MSAFRAHVLHFESGAVRFYIAYVRNSSALGRTYKIRLQVGCLCIILPPHGFNYHQLAPIVDLRVFMQYQVSWSTFVLIQPGFHTMCTKWVSLMTYLWQDKPICPPTFKSLFSFHMGSSQPRKKQQPNMNLNIWQKQARIHCLSRQRRIYRSMRNMQKWPASDVTCHALYYLHE